MRRFCRGLAERRRSRRGAEIRTLERGEGPPLAPVHGYGGAAWNFCELAPLLPGRRLMSPTCPATGPRRRCPPSASLAGYADARRGDARTAPSTCSATRWAASSHCASPSADPTLVRQPRPRGRGRDLELDPARRGDDHARRRSSSRAGSPAGAPSGSPARGGCAASSSARFEVAEPRPADGARRPRATARGDAPYRHARRGPGARPRRPAAGPRPRPLPGARALGRAATGRCPLEDGFEYARRLRAPLRVIADCGHLLICERPDVCARATLELIG